MAPYRLREEARAPRKAQESGLVAEMVRQFADAFAFVRELVQNGIDAGASRIEVRVERGTDGVGAVRVIDDGCGMTLEIIEDALLVLFRSTKDEDSSKIGKYGVGFMSVLAIEPAEVVVETWRDGGAHRVRLYPDHSYEIERGGERDGSGTSVTLLKGVGAGIEEFDELWKKVAGSLHRWCRHAEVPIELSVVDVALGEEPRRARADRALEVRAAVSVRRTFEDMEIVLGPVAGSGALPEVGSLEDAPSAFAGFYNRGLTLFETGESPREELRDVRVKVNSPRLQHTLSRDDVRRDQAFALALARAVDMREKDLRGAVLRAALEEVEKAARGGDVERLVGVLEAATIRPVSAKRGELPLPLVHAIEGRRVMSLGEVQERVKKGLGIEGERVLVARAETELTKALGRRGLPVVWLRKDEIAAAIGRAHGGSVSVAPAEEEVALVTELGAKEKMRGDDALCAGLTEALSRAGIERVALGHVSSERLAVGAQVVGARRGEVEHVVRIGVSGVVGAAWLRGAVMVLRVDSDVVDAARRATAPMIGAQLLARYLLVRGPGLSSKVSEGLAVRALEDIQ